MRRDDPVLRHARREAIVIGLVWLAATVYCCACSVWLGYDLPGRPRTEADLHPVAGIPGWFFWGVFTPWIAFGVISVVVAGWFVADDDLGADHAAELEQDIREEGERHG